MGQHDVMVILGEFPKETMTSKRIHKLLVAKGFNLSHGTVTNNLSKLIKAGFIVRYYPHGWRRPEYVLKENATKNMLNLQNQY